jgi:hypothetical protein
VPKGFPCCLSSILVLARNCQLKAYEDNEATLKMIKSGRFPAMRHVGRTHRVDLAWLHEVVDQREVDVQYVKSEEQAADIFTEGVLGRPQVGERMPAHQPRPCGATLGLRFLPSVRKAGGGISLVCSALSSFAAPTRPLSVPRPSGKELPSRVAEIDDRRHHHGAGLEKPFPPASRMVSCCGPPCHALAAARGSTSTADTPLPGARLLSTRFSTRKSGPVLRVVAQEAMRNGGSCAGSGPRAAPTGKSLMSSTFIKRAWAAHCVLPWLLVRA